MTETREAEDKRRNEPRSPLQVIRDYTLYILISLGLLASLIVLQKSGASNKSVEAYLDVFLSALLVFGILIPAYRSLWKDARFWLGALILLIAHAVFWTLLITHVAHWRMIWTICLTLPEVTGMGACAEVLAGRLSRRRMRSHHGKMEIPSGR